jgi:hypothetical protein
MTGFASLKQMGEKVGAELTEELRPLAVFAGGSGTCSGSAARPDAETGKLLLAPGTYLVMLNLQVRWKVAPSVTVAVVLGGDTRYRGPRATVEAEHGVEAILDSGAVFDSYSGGRPEWDHSAVRHVATWGVVVVPAGAPVPCEVYALAEDRHRTKVTFAQGELLAVALPAEGTK